MPSAAHLLSQSASTAAMGGVAGGLAGSASGALMAGKGQDRRAEARKWGRKGAVTGAAAGALYPAGRHLEHFMLSRYGAQLGRQLKDAPPGSSHAGTTKATLEELNEHLKGVRKSLGSREMLKSVGKRSAIVGASRPISARVKDVVKKKLQRKKAPANAENKTAGLAIFFESLYEEGVGGVKTANDPLSPNKGTPPQEENPRERRARRLAELLKRSAPTSTAEGSASPTPKRGTP